MTKGTAAICNLGCSKNVVDGEGIAGYLRAAGYQLTSDYSLAQVILVNTCAFIREATQEAIDTILEMGRYKKEGACKTLVVCGCFSQRYRDRAAKDLPEVDHWITVDNWRRDLEALFGPARPSLPLVRELSASSFQYLKISEGCSHRCSYCVIPIIRGPFRSRPSSQIVEEARMLRASGASELIVVSQDTSFYGMDQGSNLRRLIERLLRDTTFPWIRMMYLHPAYVDDGLLRLAAAEPRLCPYFDVPLQHIADPILKAMRRAPLSIGIRKLIARIRTTVPGAAIRTSIIVGFPGETERLFRELVSFVEEVRFEKLGVFPYSAEEGTAAAALRPRPRASTARRRAEIIMDIQRHISTEIGAARIGATVPVIIDGPAEPPHQGLAGRTRWDAPEVDGRVFVSRGDWKPGAIVNLPIADADAYDLYSPGQAR